MRCRMEFVVRSSEKTDAVPWVLEARPCRQIEREIISLPLRNKVRWLHSGRDEILHHEQVIMHVEPPTLNWV